MPPSHDAYRARRILGAPDGWRCVSVLGVVWHHCHGNLRFGNIGTQGNLGVAMFFVLSGFLIMTLLLREQDRTGDIALRSFYARRSLRIMPLYYGVVLVTLVVLLLFWPDGRGSTAMRRDLPYLLTYTTNWVWVGTFLAISWSLSAEEQFYLVCPAIQKLLRGAAWVLLVALLLVQELIDFGLLDGVLQQLGFGPMDLLMLRGMGFGPILLGVLLAQLLHTRRGFTLFGRVLGHRLAPLPLALALLVSLELLPEAKQGWSEVVVFVLMTLLLGSTVVREDHVLAPLLKWRPIARIGVVSYGIYLLHLPVQMLVDATAVGPGPHDGMRFVVIVLGSVLAAELSYRFYETPFLRLKTRFAR